MERGELSKTVAADQVGLDAEVAQEAEQTHRHGADGRLGDPGVAERRFLPLADFLGKRGRGINPVAEEAIAGRGGGVPERERLLHRGEAAGQVAKHSQILRALPREEHGQRARRWSEPERDHVRLPARPSRRPGVLLARVPRAGSLQAGPRLGDQAGGIGCSPLGNQDQPRVVPGLEFSPAAQPLHERPPRPWRPSSGARPHRPRPRSSPE